MNALPIPGLEIHAAHGCNLRCRGCTHFSNFCDRAIVSVEEAENWMRKWTLRLRPKVFSILGGEPGLNPHLIEFLETAACSWHGSKLQLVSNGFLLPRHAKLPEVLSRHKIALQVSLHEDTPAYRDKLQPVQELLDHWQKEYPDIEVHWRHSYGRWRMPYRDGEGRLRPFADDDPKKAYAACREKTCTQLFEGRLWKCPEVAYCRLPGVRRRLGAEWLPFLTYEGLPPNCSERELKAFFAEGAHPVCRLCPTCEHAVRPTLSDRANPAGR